MIYGTKNRQQNLLMMLVAVFQGIQTTDSSTLSHRTALTLMASVSYLSLEESLASISSTTHDLLSEWLEMGGTQSSLKWLFSFIFNLFELCALDLHLLLLCV